VLTKSISEGDTRVAGLQALLAKGAQVLDAQTGLVWPGAAAVHVATVVLAFGAVATRTGIPRLYNKSSVEFIKPAHQIKNHWLGDVQMLMGEFLGLRLFFGSR
jgi:hypothetical protein